MQIFGTININPVLIWKYLPRSKNRNWKEKNAFNYYKSKNRETNNYIKWANTSISINKDMKTKSECKHVN